jgi:hypothetical protein
MAAAVRSRLGSITRNYVQTVLLQSHTTKMKQKVCFHGSSFLYGEYCSIQVSLLCFDFDFNEKVFKNLLQGY